VRFPGPDDPVWERSRAPTHTTGPDDLLPPEIARHSMDGTHQGKLWHKRSCYIVPGKMVV